MTASFVPSNPGMTPNSIRLVHAVAQDRRTGEALAGSDPAVMIPSRPPRIRVHSIPDLHAALVIPSPMTPFIPARFHRRRRRAAADGTAGNENVVKPLRSLKNALTLSRTYRRSAETTGVTVIVAPVGTRPTSGT